MGIKDGNQYARNATQWGLGGQSEKADERTPSTKAADRHREILGWMNKATEEELRELAEWERPEALLSACSSPMDDWDWIAVQRSAAQRLRTLEAIRDSVPPIRL